MGIGTDDLEVGADIQADEVVRRTEADMAAALCRTYTVSLSNPPAPSARSGTASTMWSITAIPGDSPEVPRRCSTAQRQ